MREILFRGKSADDGEWVEGSLVITTIEPADGDPIKHYHIEDMTIGVFPNEHQSGLTETVAPETVGQYSGLTDKNGKKIFEGDVVKAVIVRDLGGGTQNREETGIIGYDKIGMIGLIAKYAGTIPVWSDFFQELTLSGCIDDFWFEVIGNIHDNPGLLDEK